MKKITSLFVYNKVGSNGEPKAMVCINNSVFVSAKWLNTETKLPIHLFSLLIGSSIDVTYFIKDEVITPAVTDDKGKVITPEVLCTDEGKIVKSFVIEEGVNLMVAKLVADKLAA